MMRLLSAAQFSSWKHAGPFIEKYPQCYSAFFEYSQGGRIDLPHIKGPSFSETDSIESLLDSYSTMGIQASVFGKAVTELNQMLHWRLSDEPPTPQDRIQDPEERKRTRCTIYLGHPSNIMTSGLREVIKFLVQNKLVDAIVTTAGSIEEDFLKCLGPFNLGEFTMDGATLCSKGWLRSGNIIVKTDLYTEFYEKTLPILDELLYEQKSTGKIWTPSTLIERLALGLGDETSVNYWAAKNKIPVFCPAIIDGGLGECIFMHSIGNPGLIIDLVQDQKRIYDMACSAHKVGALIVGGGVSKHFILNTQIVHGGLDFAVYINTAQEFDGSDGGASPDEAKSWGKINAQAKPVKLFAEASLVYPLLVAKTFVPYLKKVKSGEVKV